MKWEICEFLPNLSLRFFFYLSLCCINGKKCFKIKINKRALQPTVREDRLINLALSTGHEYAKENGFMKSDKFIQESKMATAHYYCSLQLQTNM